MYTCIHVLYICELIITGGVIQEKIHFHWIALVSLLHFGSHRKKLATSVRLGRAFFFQSLYIPSAVSLSFFSLFFTFDGSDDDIDQIDILAYHRRSVDRSR